MVTWRCNWFVLYYIYYEYYIEHNSTLFPAELFQLFQSLIGPKSIQFANKCDGRRRRDCYGKVFSHEHIKAYYHQVQEV